MPKKHNSAEELGREIRTEVATRYGGDWLAYQEAQNRKTIAWFVFGAVLILCLGILIGACL